MTSEEHKALVDRLRSVDISWSETGEWCAEASDQIEADGQRIAELEARYEKSQDQIDRLIADKERITDRLGWICAVMDLDNDVSLEWIYTELEALIAARAALGETK